MTKLLPLIFFSLTLAQDSTLVLTVESDIFTIDSVDPQLQWLSPNGGESYESGGVMPAEWNAEDDSFEASPLSIYIATSIGASFDPIAENTDNDGSEALNLPEIDIWHARFKIIALDSFGNSSEDYSDGYIIVGEPTTTTSEDSTLTINTETSTFTIDSKDPDIAISSPVGGEQYDSAGQAECTWSASDDSFSDTPISIALSASIGASFESLIDATVNDASEPLSLPEIDTDYARVRLAAVDIYGNTSDDESPGYFTIGEPEEFTGEDSTLVIDIDSDTFTIDSADPYLDLLSPDGGEEYISGGSMSVMWEASDDSFDESPIDTYISTDIGAEYVVLQDNLANTGTSVADAPLESTAYGRVKIIATDSYGNSSDDESEGYFSIIQLGDMNGDGAIDVLDIVLMVDCALQIGSGYECYDEVADLNSDGVINILDVVTLVNWVLYGVPTDTVTDADGNVYETIQIGEQLWMADNLRVGHYNNYETIPAHFDFYDWTELTTGACLSIGDSLYFYESDELNEIYGKLYNWYAVNDERGICPNGFHVPSDDDWTTLSTFLDANTDPFSYYGVQSNIAGGMLKSTGNIQEVTGLWSAPNTAATNESGFTAVPAGFRSGDYGNYGMFTYGSYYWSTSVDYDEAWNRAMYFDLSGLFRFSVSKNHAYSVRCLKD